MRACIALSTRIGRSRLLSAVPCSRAFSISRAAAEHYKVSSLLQQDGPIDDVQVNGWIRTYRKQRRVAFLALGDGSTIEPLQAVLSPEQCDGLSNGTAVKLTGSWTKSSGKGQSNELQVTNIQVCGENDAENSPIQPKYQSLDFLRTVPHLRPRIPTNALLLRLRSSVIASLTAWFHRQGYVQCHTPIITSSDCEGAGEVFSVLSGEEVAAKANDKVHPFFKSQKYLTVSAQLHLEALSQAVDKVWTLSPTFRAEKSDTPRHLAEFYMLEAELCFVQSADEVMDVVENMLRAVAQDLQSSDLLPQLLQARQSTSAAQNDDSITTEQLDGRWHGLLATSWPRITYDEAVDILKEAHDSNNYPFQIPPSYSDGLAAEHERYIAAVVGRGSPVFVTRYPAEQKPFYMAPVAGNNKLVDCFDLLVPDICELVGGSLREHKLQELEQVMKDKNVSGDALDWYKDLRRYGSVSHGGFGLGFDRLICYLSGVSSIRDVVSFPRYHGRADC